MSWWATDFWDLNTGFCREKKGVKIYPLTSMISSKLAFHLPVHGTKYKLRTIAILCVLNYLWSLSLSKFVGCFIWRQTLTFTFPVFALESPGERGGEEHGQGPRPWRARKPRADKPDDQLLESRGRRRNVGRPCAAGSCRVRRGEFHTHSIIDLWRLVPHLYCLRTPLSLFWRSSHRLQAAPDVPVNVWKDAAMTLFVKHRGEDDEDVKTVLERSLKGKTHYMFGPEKCCK